jgi:transposase InsO family protein
VGGTTSSASACTVRTASTAPAAPIEWPTAALGLSQAIFEWIESWYNPRRRHTSISDLSPIAYEQCATGADVAA